jgi:hypothetical protein
MKELLEKNVLQRFTISDISQKIESDIAYLRENLEIFEEGYEKKLVEDIERFLLDDLAREIRLSLYDPLQNNRVYMEYCYKVESFSSFVSQEKWDRQVRIRDFPETCLFDIFIYFSEKFAELKPEFHKEFLKDFNLDWYDLSLSLEYGKKNKRKKAGAIHSEKLSVNRYLYESPAEEDISGDSVALIDGKPGILSEKGMEGAEKFSKFEKKIIEAVQGGQKLNFVVYKDMESAIVSIGYALRQYKKIPVRWSLSRGFTMDKWSNKSQRSDFSSMRDAKNPSTALNFIIENKEERVSYIFEDFHHHIGGSSAINSAAAEVRSITRELSRNLRDRDEYVFFLSPSDSLPVELLPVFNVIKQEVEGKQDTSFLNRYGYDMTDPSFCGLNKPLIGREDKIKRMIQILCQMETNNPVLVGEAGVGKTALVEGLASQIVRGNVPSALKGATIFSINLNTLVAGSKYRGDFEDRINRVLEEVRSNFGKVIVFIDEIHTLLGAGSAEGAAGAEDILKPALARGDFPCIGATTREGYESLLRDPALARRFQKLDIPPATVNESKHILSGVRHVFEKHHGVRITDEAIQAAVTLGAERIHGQFLPGKAVRLLDSASAYVKLDGRQIVSAKDIGDEIKRGQ